MRLFLILFFSITALAGYAQHAMENINLELIPQKKIRELIRHQFAENDLQHFNELHATFRKGQELKGYHYLESVYRLREIPEKVWETYQVTSPAASWNGNMISFGLLISKWEERVMYRDDSYYQGIDTGQVFYVNLRIMKGIYNLAVGLEIVSIDSTNKSITFSYLKGGKSRGQQTIYFVSTKRGYTEIIHRTAFKSDSYIRDRYLYPYFHRIAINEFHRNMKRCLEG